MFYYIIHNMGATKGYQAYGRVVLALTPKLRLTMLLSNPVSTSIRVSLFAFLASS